MICLLLEAMQSERNQNCILTEYNVREVMYRLGEQILDVV